MRFFHAALTFFSRVHVPSYFIRRGLKFVASVFAVSLFLHNFAARIKKESLIMETKSLNRPVRTKDEILTWLNAARQRKEAWEKKVDAKFAERLRSKKAAADSGYYDLEWV
ncbi:MAG: hypothetical protein K6D55_11680 [Prevotella sp.]|nr:hypothetical protein [Prevotella sp.]